MGTHLPNVPTEKEIARLTAQVKKVLLPKRDLFWKPIKVNSGFCTPAVNQAIKGATG